MVVVGSGYGFQNGGPSQVSESKTMSPLEHQQPPAGKIVFGVVGVQTDRFPHRDYRYLDVLIRYLEHKIQGVGREGQLRTFPTRSNSLQVTNRLSKHRHRRPLHATGSAVTVHNYTIRGNSSIHKTLKIAKAGSTDHLDNCRGLLSRRAPGSPLPKKLIQHRRTGTRLVFKSAKFLDKSAKSVEIVACRLA